MGVDPRSVGPLDGLSPRRLCNIAYAYLRRDLVQALAMADGKDRAKALEEFDLWVNAPLEGWAEADKKLNQLIQQA